MKVNQTSLNLEKRHSLSFQISDFVLLSSGLLLGCSSTNSMILGLNYVLIAYFYDTNIKSIFLIGIGYIATSFMFGWVHSYRNLLFACIFALLVAFVRLLRGNLYLFFPALVALVTFASTLVIEQEFNLAIWNGFLSMTCSIVSLNNTHHSRNQFKVSPMVLAILLISVVSVFHGFELLKLEQISLIFVMCVAALALPMRELVIMMLLTYGIFNMPEYYASIAIGVLLCNSLKECGKGAQWFGLVLPVAIASMDYKQIIIVTIFFLLSWLLSITSFGTLLEVESDLQFEKQRLASKEKMLEHQLNQFAAIFYTISQFFQGKHKAETTFLNGMAKSMELLSSQLKESASYSQDESVKIYNLLKGYNYTVTKVDVSENELGQKRIVLNFDECSKRDVDDVIVPLLQMVVDKNLRLFSWKRNRLFKSPVRIELCGAKPLNINVQTFKIKKLDDASGDTCSLFQVKQNTICTLSDGMGAGSNAQRSSNFITHLIQRLLSVHIPTEMAVKSINALLKLYQEESFATLDILSFDALSKQVYISKSGACPTFLIRNNQVLKIQGQSLPLGIVTQIEADCFSLETKSGDVFVMCSDGVDENDLQLWLESCEEKDYAKQIKTQMEKLNTKDDATVLLAEVTKR